MLCFFVFFSNHSYETFSTDHTYISSQQTKIKAMSVSMLIQQFPIEHCACLTESVSFTLPLLQCCITVNSSKSKLTAGATALQWKHMGIIFTYIIYITRNRIKLMD